MAEAEKTEVRGETFQERRVRLDERTRMEEEQNEDAEKTGVKEKAIFALVLASVIAVSILLPLIAALAGLAVRCFRFAAGW